MPRERAGQARATPEAWNLPDPKAEPKLGGRPVQCDGKVTLMRRAGRTWNDRNDFGGRRLVAPALLNLREIVAVRRA
jgi:hypothetical protein